MIHRSKIIAVALVLSALVDVYGQEKLEIEGAITVKDSEADNPAPGTIRFNPESEDFEGWNGHCWLSLTRLRQSGSGVLDASGQSYSTVKLGTQEWMAENLRTAKYNDGSPIPNVTEGVQWQNLSTGAWCYYLNDTQYAYPHGKLYNWHAVGTDKLCPFGWHVPDSTDWAKLINYVGGMAIAGNALKEEGTIHWNESDLAVTNESRFTALAAGQRDGAFYYIGENGFWWSATEVDTQSARFIFMADAFPTIFDMVGAKDFGQSVRCLKD